jgi:hypothetical protein
MEPRVLEFFQVADVVPVLRPFRLLATDQVAEAKKREFPPAVRSHLAPGEELRKRVKQVVLPPELKPLLLAGRQRAGLKPAERPRPPAVPLDRGPAGK